MQKFSQRNFAEEIGQARRYTPAILRHLNGESGWLIEYFIFNPIVGLNERRRIYLNTIRKKFRTVADFRVYANDIICDLNVKLASGWTPWAEHENARSFTTLEEVFNKYMEEKRRDLRGTTLHSYESFCNMFMRWIEQKYKGCKAGMMTKEMALEYIEYMQDKQNWTARTFNNNVKQGRAIFAWAVKKCYCAINPFDGIDTQRVQKKSRTIIPADVIRQIDTYYAEHLPQMRIVMRLVYTSLLRPVEISRVQVCQIDFQRHCIHMPGDKTKNWDSRDARLDEELEDMLRRHILGAHPEDYLFADQKWRCGKNPMRSHTFSNAWESMRAHMLDDKKKRIIPDEFQLYSLKDTAINGMIKSGVDDLSVMQAAGHKDLKMTQIYADHTDVNLINDLNQTAPKFGEEVVKPCIRKLDA